LNGYSTAQFGKCHEVPVWQSSPMGPFDAWPSAGGGFEYFYGFIGGENNQWDPALYEGTTPIEPPATPEEGYHLTEDLADHAVSWIRQQKALMPDKPFFMYFAPGATHAPHHVPKEWADKYKGQFDDGWDAQRERTFARQKELGVIPADADLTVRHDEIPAWDEMPDELKPVLAREMEVYAGFLEHTDHHVGRLIDALEDLEILGDTIVYYIIGDNGASAEGTLNGAFNEMANFNGMAALETPEFMNSKWTSWGHPPRTTITRSAGHGPWTPPFNGPSRSPPTGAAPATARSSIGPTGSRRKVGCARSSPTSSTSLRRSWRPPASPNRRPSTGCSSRRWRARACSTPSTTPRPLNGMICSTSRCSPTAASTTRAGAPSRSTARLG
jgi:arylsulfatase